MPAPKYLLKYRAMFENRLLSQCKTDDARAVWLNEFQRIREKYAGRWKKVKAAKAGK